ncbi:MAG: hypothetical protein U0Q55_23540 [Vicinamibacterales bacterium]
MFLPHADPIHKVTIIPRGMALGLTMQLADGREAQLLARLSAGPDRVLLGGHRRGNPR